MILNYRIVAFGTPYGYQTSQSQKEDYFLDNFYSNNQSGTKFGKIKRPNGDVHYVYLKYADKDKRFGDGMSGRPGAFFGMSLVLHDQEFKDDKQVLAILSKLYDTEIKGKIVEEHPNGNKSFKIRNMDDKLACKLEESIKPIIKDIFSRIITDNKKTVTPNTQQTIYQQRQETRL